MPRIPQPIPVVGVIDVTAPVVADDSAFFSYDIAIAGQGFRYANSATTPTVWQTAPYTRNQVDQAAEPGEQTMSNWWLKSQSSFHGGAGQLQLERVDAQPAQSHIRFDASKNVDVWTPGRVTRLPDAAVVTTDTPTNITTAGVAGQDCLYYTTPAGVLKRITLSSPPVVETYASITEPVFSVASDGVHVYAASHTGVWRVPTNDLIFNQLKICTYPAAATDAVVSWVKARLMLGVAGSVYEVDSTVTTTAALGDDQLRYHHPTPGWSWTCFAESPAAIFAAGDSGNTSLIVRFDETSDNGTPVLVVAATVANLPIGELVLSMAGSMGNFMALGTTSGCRIAQFDPYTNNMVMGPLTQPETDPAFPVAAVTTRDRFIYLAGLAYDEPGLVRIDLGAQTDAAGRFAYAPDLISPVAPSAGVPTPATAVTVAPVTDRVVFTIPGVGLMVEGVGPGTGREAWLRTSRIRYNTVEPKLFKLGLVRGELAAGEIIIDGITPHENRTLVEVGFTTTDPDEFTLPTEQAEWLQLKLTLVGATCVLDSYEVKALPGIRRQRMMQCVVSIADNETDRRGRQHVDIGSARARTEALFELDAAGDVIIFEEFTLNGTSKTQVMIDKVTFQMTATPTNTSDWGGTASITLRTVDS